MIQALDQVMSQNITHAARIKLALMYLSTNHCRVVIWSQSVFIFLTTIKRHMQVEM